MKVDMPLNQNKQQKKRNQSHHVRVWHKAIFVEGCARIETCSVGEKILDPVGIPLMERLKHQAINSVLLKQAKTWRTAPLRSSVIVSERNHPVRMPRGRLATNFTVDKHPRQLLSFIKQIPQSNSNRLTDNSSNENTYEITLKNNRFSTTLIE